MAEDIKKVIKNIMGQAQDEPQKRRSLIPYLMTANEILRSNIPQKKIPAIILYTEFKFWNGIRA